LRLKRSALALLGRVCWMRSSLRNAFTFLMNRVPPGHAKHWNKHCRKYNACGQPVYFVQDRWYQQVYVPRYREIHNGGHSHGHGKGHKGD
jgi:hypothetical protein